MGEENRGSSGGGTAMIVVAILGGILVVGCCGGTIVFGLGSLVWMRNVPMEMQAQPPMAVPRAVEDVREVNKALDDLKKEIEPLKVPDDVTDPVRTDPGTLKESLEGVPDLKGPPALEEKQE